MGVRTGAGMVLSKDAGPAAAHAAEVLGTLRGLAAKVGQMASYVDGLVPPQHAEAFESSLKALRAQAPKSSPVDIRRLVEEELKGPIDTHFASWSDAPLASASIGQVHRATLPDGTEVAVKVQHPGIHSAVESDLANAGLIESFAGAFGGKRFDTKTMMAVIKARFREELDYAHEAGNLQRFAELHIGDPTVRVPRLVETHSSRRVLTTELALGATFDEACTASEEERNYVFHEGGRVTFLDYGCIQRIDDRRARAVGVHRAALAKDEQEFGRAVSRMVNAKPGPLEDTAIRYTRECFRPLFESPYRVTKPYAASLVNGMKDMALVAMKVPEEQLFTMPGDMFFVNRLQFGFYSVLARLDVETDYARVESGFIPAE